MLITAPEAVGMRPDGANTATHRSRSLSRSRPAHRKRLSTRSDGYETCTDSEAESCESEDEAGGGGEGAKPAAGHAPLRATVEWTLERARSCCRCAVPALATPFLASTTSPPPPLPRSPATRRTP